MTLRFPLFAKILLWFFLNLLFLGVVFFALFKFQFRVGLDSLLLGRTGDRFHAVSEIITAELGTKPDKEWGAVIKQFSSAYKVKFLLFRADGSQAGGEQTELPKEVQRRVTERRGPPDFGGMGAGMGPPPGRGPDRMMNNPQPNLPRLGPLPPPPFMLHTDQPTRYWVGTRIFLQGVEPRRGGPMTLLAVSNSLWGGGLFLDITPWVAMTAAVVILSVLFWLPLVRGVTRSVSQMTRATERIAEGRFDTRVDARRSDELGRLGQAINQMAGRLHGFVTGQRRFLGDIAHELCSPIARVQVALGILEQRADAKQQAYVDDVREEVQHMSSLVSELLSFSKASLEPAAVRLQPVDLRAVAEQAVRREAGEAPTVRNEIPDGLKVMADPELLMRALANLIRNAVRYASHAGPVTLAATRAGEQVTLTVSDCGPGVSEESLPQLFDPFYRPELSRSAESGGVGLGLAIVKTCVESCQGAVSCRNRSPSGLEVTVRLKAASPAVEAPAQPSGG